MSSKATEDMLDMLHRTTAEQLADIIKNGVTVLDKEGNQVRQPAPAAYIATAIKFLKDNDITADPGADRFTKVTDAITDLPTFSDEDAYH